MNRCLSIQLPLLRLLPLGNPQLSSRWHHHHRNRNYRKVSRGHSGFSSGFACILFKCVFFVSAASEGEQARKSKSRHAKPQRGYDEDEEEEIHGRPASYADSGDEHGHGRMLVALSGVSWVTGMCS
jgi:hypothetical protein